MCNPILISLTSRLAQELLIIRDAASIRLQYYIFRSIEIMHKNTIISFTLFFIITLTSSALAENITEPESFMLVNTWLSSEPQPGADHHVIRVCQDDEMIEDCTQCIYQASGDGAVHIPMYNRCVFRTYQWRSYQWGSYGYQEEQALQSYILYWQVKAVSAGGSESEWTEPKRVHIQNQIINEFSYCKALLSVQYNF